MGAKRRRILPGEGPPQGAVGGAGGEAEPRTGGISTLEQGEPILIGRAMVVEIGDDLCGSSMSMLG